MPDLPEVSVPRCPHAGVRTIRDDLTGALGAY